MITERGWRLFKVQFYSRTRASHTVIVHLVTEDSSGLSCCKIVQVQGNSLSSDFEIQPECIKVYSFLDMQTTHECDWKTESTILAVPSFDLQPN
jgi:hypothetical protein